MIFTLASVSFGQSDRPTLGTPASPAPETRSKLVLEVAYNPSLSPSYIPVNGVDAKPHWVWVTRFRQLPGWQLPANASPIRAVRFEAQFNGETADVKVTVLRGQRRFDQEDLVGTYHLGLNEPRVVEQLKAFGIEPATITLLAPQPVLPLWPTVINKTNSVGIDKIVLEGDPLPGYRVLFRNFSEKKLAALKVEVTRPSGEPISAFFQGEDGRPLIESGAATEQYLPAIRTPVSGSGTPGSPVANSIVISSAVFSDGTFDGDVGPACLLESFNLGRKIWMKRVLPLIEDQLSKPNDDAPSAAMMFKDKFNALQYPLEGLDGRNYSTVSKNCPSPQAGVEVAIAGQKLAFLRQLDSIITTRPAPRIDFKRWLQTTAERYRAWLKRMRNDEG